jgi:hypothetical protein
MTWPHKDAVRVYCMLSYTYPYERLLPHYTYLWLEPDFPDGGMITIGNNNVFRVTKMWGFKIKQP